MERFSEGLGDAWASVGEFLPKTIGFLLIVIVGYLVAKIVEKIVDRVLERAGFDRVVERGGVGKALAGSKYDASSLLAKVAFYAIFLFVLQLAFGAFGPNPVSSMINGVVAYLPNLFAAILIVVIAAAIAAAVKDIVGSALGSLSYGRALATAASVAILIIGGFAALDQLQIAPAIVNTLFIGVVALLVGAGIVAIGGGGIQTMAKYWQQAARRVEQETSGARSATAETREPVESKAGARR